MAKIGRELLLTILMFRLIINQKSLAEENQLKVSPGEKSFRVPAINCFSNFLLLHGGPDLTYAAVLAPITVNSGACNNTRTYLSKRLAKLGKSLDWTEKIRHIYCYIGIVSAPLEIYTSPETAELPAEDRFGFLQPDSWILLAYSGPTDPSLMTQVLDGVIFTLVREKAIQDPAIHFLAVNRHTGLNSCWMLHAAEFVTAFKEECSHVDAFMTPRREQKQGYDMKWGYSTTPGYVYGRAGRGLPFCPFTLKNNENYCSLSEAERTFKVVVESFNMSIRAVKGRKAYPIPTISFGRIWRRRHPFDIEMTGYAADVCFITSDSVTLAYDSNLFKLVGAFQTELWIVVMATLVLLSLAISFSEGHTFYGLIIPNFCTITGLLLDQYTSLARVERTAYIKVTKLILLTWTIASIVLNSSFKGCVKSNSIVPNRYGTNWTNLLQLQGFKLIFGYNLIGGANCTSMDDWLRTVKTLRGRDLSFSELLQAFRVGALIVSNFERRATFSLLDELGNLETSLHSGIRYEAGYEKWLHERAKILRILTERADVVCETSLERRIKSDLWQPRTAFITTKELFLMDWQKFEDFTARSKLGVKFAHSCAVEDGSLRAFQGFYITGRLTGSEGELVLKRMRGLVSSGIYSEWKKWDTYRLALNQAKPVTQKNAVPLSLTGSDVHIWFVVLCFTSFAAISMFGLELLWKCIIADSTALAPNHLRTWFMYSVGSREFVSSYE